MGLAEPGLFERRWVGAQRTPGPLVTPAWGSSTHISTQGQGQGEARRGEAAPKQKTPEWPRGAQGPAVPMVLLPSSGPKGHCHPAPTSPGVPPRSPRRAPRCQRRRPGQGRGSEGALVGSWGLLNSSSAGPPGWLRVPPPAAPCPAGAQSQAHGWGVGAVTHQLHVGHLEVGLLQTLIPVVPLPAGTCEGTKWRPWDPGLPARGPVYVPHVTILVTAPHYCPMCIRSSSFSHVTVPPCTHPTSLPLPQWPSPCNDLLV